MGKQEEVDIFMNQYNLNIKPEYRLIDLSSELGEVGKQVLKQTGYGERSLKRTDNLEEELGDLYFALIALANTMGIDLDFALEKVLEKYKKRIKKNEDPGSEKSI